MADRSTAGRAPRMRRGLRDLRTEAVRLVADRRGAAVAYFGLLLPLLLGAAGLGIDIGASYSARQRAQTQAEAAAMAAALELNKASPRATITSAATADATSNGLDTARGDRLTVNIPPTQGGYAGDAKAAEAVVQSSVRQILAPFVGGASTVTISARAVARVVRADACVWALEPTATGIDTTGTADVNLSCGIYARSSSGQALSVGGSSCVHATSIATPGGYSGTCLSPAPQTGAAVLGDPLASLPQPSNPGCSNSGGVHISNGNRTLSPGTYCGGVQISGGTITFQPGLYVIAGDSLQVTGNASLSGQGVTFFFTSRTGSYATFSINAASLDLSAPTSGPYAGLLMFQDRGAPTSTQDSLAGTASLNLGGIVYLPTAALSFAGTSSAGQLAPLLVVRTLHFVGTSRLGSPGVPVPAGQPDVALVE